MSSFLSQMRPRDSRPRPSLRAHLLASTEIPLTWILGLAGLLPMALGLFAPLYGAPKAALLYGTVICAFMAGTHWGLALYAPDGQARELRLVLSVAPALPAWGTAFLTPTLTALALTALFGLLFAGEALFGASRPARSWLLAAAPDSQRGRCAVLLRGRADTLSRFQHPVRGDLAAGQGSSHTVTD